MQEDGSHASRGDDGVHKDRLEVGGDGPRVNSFYVPSRLLRDDAEVLE